MLPLNPATSRSTAGTSGGRGAGVGPPHHQGGDGLGDRALDHEAPGAPSGHAAASAAAPPARLDTTEREAMTRWPNSRSRSARWVAPAAEIGRMKPSAVSSGAT